MNNSQFPMLQALTEEKVDLGKLLGVKDAKALKKGVSFPCSKEEYDKNTLKWLTKLDFHGGVSADWGGNWKNGTATFTY